MDKEQTALERLRAAAHACEESREACKSRAMAAQWGGDIREGKHETDA